MLTGFDSRVPMAFAISTTADRPNASGTEVPARLGRTGAPSLDELYRRLRNRIECVLVVSVLQPEYEYAQLGAFCVELRIPKRVMPRKSLVSHAGHDPKILSLWRFKAPN